MRPATDLCWRCQDGANKVTQAANRPDGEKAATIAELEEHLRIVGIERNFYQDIIQKVTATQPAYLLPECHEYCSCA